MLRINGRDLSDYQLHRTPYDFEFNHAPGSITYLPIQQIRLYNPPSRELEPQLVYSPLLFKKVNPTFVMGDEGSIFGNYEGEILQTISMPSVIELTVQDRLAQTLTKTQVLAVYRGMTPAEIAGALMGQYGVPVDPGNVGVISEWQRQNGMIFDLEILLPGNATLQDMLSRLCEAGFMRAALFVGRLYLIGTEIGTPRTTIVPGDCHSYPTQIRADSRPFNGAEIVYLSDPITQSARREPDPDVSAPAYNADYSNPPLRIVNFNGAESLADAYTNEKLFSRYYQIDLDYEIAYALRPGDFVKLDIGILSVGNPVIARLTSRRRKGDNTDYSAECTFEVNLRFNEG